MPEFWVEENIRPINRQGTTIDQLLVNDIKPIVDYLKQKNILSWHFFREDSGWQGGSQNIRHLRVRFEATDLAHLKRIRMTLKKKLDDLQNNNRILDHYVGKHGRPVRLYRNYYSGENIGYDEQNIDPKGWYLVKQSLNIGSEIALLLIKGRLGNVQLGTDYTFGKISHLFPNQCRHYPFIPRAPNWPRDWIVYDTNNPN